MSMSFTDFVEDIKVMLGRTPPATDEEIIRYLKANDVREVIIPDLIESAKSQVKPV